MAEGNGRIAARNPLRPSLAPMVTLRMRANFLHDQGGCALSWSCRGLTSAWSMSLSLDLHPLRLGRWTRSGAAPSCFRKKFGGAIALCASRGELHKHAWALRHLGQELGHMSVVLVRTCLPCWT